MSHTISGVERVALIFKNAPILTASRVGVKMIFSPAVNTTKVCLRDYEWLTASAGDAWWLIPYEGLLMTADRDVTCLVVPCYNEALRLRGEAFARFVEGDAGVHFLFVNDGSGDGTLGVLETLCARRPDALRVLHKERNGGKAEAVRDGMNEAMSSGRYGLVGFWDADLATPLEAVPYLLETLRGSSRLEMVFGSRVRLLGREIHRQAMRHYLGRCFATLASVTLGLPIYDTQCGAKVFRVSPALREVMAEPFVSKWIFDVEILARFLRLKGREFCCAAIYEFPLHAWNDVGGSKVKPGDFFRAIGDLVKIRRQRER